MSCGVYKITCIKNNKIYIGSSANIEQRLYNHKYHLRKNNHSNRFLQNDWNKYGEENFKFEILEECDKEFHYQLEQKYIDELLPFHRNGRGYNISEKSTERNDTPIKIYKVKPRNYYNLILKDNVDYKFNDLMKDDKLLNKIKELSEDYNIVGGRLVDKDTCNNNTREELEDYVCAMNTYDYISDYIYEMNGYDDDWE